MAKRRNYLKDNWSVEYSNILYVRDTTRVLLFPPRVYSLSALSCLCNNITHEIIDVRCLCHDAFLKGVVIQNTSLKHCWENTHMHTLGQEKGGMGKSLFLMSLDGKTHEH